MFHFDAVVQEMIINGIWETLYMTLASTFMGYVLGLPRPSWRPRGPPWPCAWPFRCCGRCWTL